MLMATRVTYITMPYAWHDLPKLVTWRARDPAPGGRQRGDRRDQRGRRSAVIDNTIPLPRPVRALRYGTDDTSRRGGVLQSLDARAARASHPATDSRLCAAHALVRPAWSGERAHHQQACDALYVRYPQISAGRTVGRRS